MTEYFSEYNNHFSESIDGKVVRLDEPYSQALCAIICAIVPQLKINHYIYSEAHYQLPLPKQTSLASLILNLNFGNLEIFHFLDENNS